MTSPCGQAGLVGRPAGGRPRRTAAPSASSAARRRPGRRAERAWVASPVSMICSAIAHGLVDRDREAEADRAGSALPALRRRRCAIAELMPTTLAVQVDQRAAGVARVDRGVGLDRGVRSCWCPGRRTRRRCAPAGSSALTMPLVTVPSRPSGEPIATTCSPTWRSAELPRVAGVRPETPSALITARSVTGRVPTTRRVRGAAVVERDRRSCRPSPAPVDDVVVGEDQPSEERTMPEPSPPPWRRATSIETTLGSTSARPPPPSRRRRSRPGRGVGLGGVEGVGHRRAVPFGSATSRRRHRCRRSRERAPQRPPRARPVAVDPSAACPGPKVRRWGTARAAGTPARSRVGMAAGTGRAGTPRARLLSGLPTALLLRVVATLLGAALASAVVVHRSRARPPGSRPGAPDRREHCSPSVLRGSSDHRRERPMSGQSQR